VLVNDTKAISNILRMSRIYRAKYFEQTIRIFAALSNRRTPILTRCKVEAIGNRHTENHFVTKCKTADIDISALDAQRDGRARGKVNETNAR